MIKYAFLVLIALILVGCNVVPVAGVRYRKQGAYQVQLGYAGYKQTEGINHFVPAQMPVYSPEVQPVIITHMYMNSDQSLDAAVDAAAQKGLINADLNTHVINHDKESGTFVVAQLLNTIDMVKSLNSDQNKGIRQYLFDQGSRARIVTTVLTAYSYEKTSAFKLNTTVAGKFVSPVNPANGSFTIAADGTNVLRLSDGTTFGYEMSRVAWHKTPEGKVEISQILLDRVGFDPKPRPGDTLDPEEL